VVLFDQTVEVLGWPDLALIALGMPGANLFGQAMRGVIAVERDLCK
jgi:hypothetical protein